MTTFGTMRALLVRMQRLAVRHYSTPMRSTQATSSTLSDKSDQHCRLLFLRCVNAFAPSTFRFVHSTSTAKPTQEIRLPPLLDASLCYNLPMPSTFTVAITEPLPAIQRIQDPDGWCTIVRSSKRDTLFIAVPTQTPVTEAPLPRNAPMEAKRSGNRMHRVRRRKMKWHRLQKRWRKNKTAIMKRFEKWEAKV